MKQKNHFFFGYTGNKKDEVDEIINNIKFTDIENIVETFCGSSAISFHIWMKYGDKFNYYLNDNSIKIIEIYNLFINHNLDHINDEIKKIIDKIDNKNDWINYYKNGDNTIYKNLFFHKYSARGRLGFYPLGRGDLKNKQIKPTQLQELFIKFIQAPYVYITCDDWYNIFNIHKNNENSIIILDPPYMDSNNDFYLEKTINVYEYFYNNKIETFKSHIYLILEDMWIIRMLFNNNKFLTSYNKKYEISKKKTKHTIIYNH